MRPITSVEDPIFHNLAFSQTLGYLCHRRSYGLPDRSRRVLRKLSGHRSHLDRLPL
jgi:hypothetical protein